MSSHYIKSKGGIMKHDTFKSICADTMMCALSFELNKDNSSQHWTKNLHQILTMGCTKNTYVPGTFSRCLVWYSNAMNQVEIVRKPGISFICDWGVDKKTQGTYKQFNNDNDTKDPTYEIHLINGREGTFISQSSDNYQLILIWLKCLVKKKYPFAENWLEVFKTDTKTTLEPTKWISNEVLFHHVCLLPSSEKKDNTVEKFGYRIRIYPGQELTLDRYDDKENDKENIKYKEILSWGSSTRGMVYPFFSEKE